jgi:hypothetical protein
MFNKRVISAVILTIMISGCSPKFTIKAPDGFAVFNRETKIYKAISSDGIKITAYTVDNDPYGDIGMWKEAVDFYLRGNGYHEALKKDIAAGNNMKGVYTEYLYRFNAENYIYSLALFVDEKNIYIIQTGGIKSFYDGKREGILKSISGFTVDK